MVGEGEGQEARISFLPWFLGLATHPSRCFRPRRAGPWQVRDPLAAGLAPPCGCLGLECASPSPTAFPGAVSKLSTPLAAGTRGEGSGVSDSLKSDSTCMGKMS